MDSEQCGVRDRADNVLPASRLTVELGMVGVPLVQERERRDYLCGGSGSGGGVDDSGGVVEVKGESKGMRRSCQGYK